MSKGNDSRVHPKDARRETKDGNRKGGQPPRSSRSSVRMTAERARAIQAHADRGGVNQDFKARAMSAADRDDTED